MKKNRYAKLRKADATGREDECGSMIPIRLARSGGWVRAAVLLILLILFGAGARAETTASQTLHFTQAPEVGPVEVQSRFFGYQSAVDRDLTGGEAAYDYSVHLIKDGSLYRLYCGGRWRDTAKNPPWDGDHVMQYDSPSGNAGTWSMPHNRPEFPQGREEGYPNTWYANNYLEPEVVKVNGVYYAYTQCEIDPGAPIDQAGKTATTQADRIQLHTSSDGLNWQCYSRTSGVVVNIAKPESTCLHHQEMVYVPWDKDGKPWWMFVAYNVDNTFYGYCRIRSAVPTSFDFATRQAAGLAQLGNQTGYIRQAPGGPLFVRITFVDNGLGRTVPSLQFSRDGLTWFWGTEGPTKMAGSDDNVNNKNCYFLGLSTLNGTGELERVDGHTWRAIYGATTSNTPVAPDIFQSEVGAGELTLRLPNMSGVRDEMWRVLK